MTAACRVSAFLVIMFPWFASADSSPVPNSIHGLYGKRTETCFGKKCEKNYADTILVTPLGSEYARIDISLLYQNGERCEVQGDGAWKDQHLVIEITNPSVCMLHLYFSPRKVVLRDDAENPCVRLFCGFNGSLNTTLPKKGGL